MISNGNMLKKAEPFLTLPLLINYGILKYFLPLEREGMDASRRAYIEKPKLSWSLLGLGTVAAILLGFVPSK